MARRLPSGEPVSRVRARVGMHTRTRAFVSNTYDPSLVEEKNNHYARAKRAHAGEARVSGSCSSLEPMLKLVWNKPEVPTEQQEAVAAWARQLPRKHRPPTDGGLQRKKVADELSAMLESDEWEQARPVHLVELYCLLHENVYGVEALDLRGQLNRQACARMVLTMLRRDFDDEVPALVDYMRWSWQREESREEWRRRNNTGRRRLTWRIQFGGELLTEFLMQRVKHG